MLPASARQCMHTTTLTQWRVLWELYYKESYPVFCSNFLVKKSNMVTTKHCCYGTCQSDSRYSDREHMKGVFFLPFPKPKKDLEKCKKWVHACRRAAFTTNSVTKDTYICSKHFVGGNGPTPENPHPIPATKYIGIQEVSRQCR